MGLDWAAIRAEYELKASPEELAPVNPTETPEQRTARRGPRSGHEYGDGSAATIPRGQILAMYKDGASIAKIAAHFGVHRSGIYKHLHAAADRGQIELRDDRRTLSGAPKRSVCVSGDHSMEDGDPNVRIDSNGARHCRACDKRRRSKSRT
jgi:hypothetical protein